MKNATEKKRERNLDRYDQVTAAIGIVCLFAVVLWLVYITSLALITPFMPDKIEHYVVGTNTVINNTESIVNLSFNPELWVFKLMTEEPKGVVCLVWFLDLFLWASYVFMIPYLLVTATKFKFWPVNKFRVFFFGREEY